MTRKFLTVFVALLFLLPLLSFAQTRALLFPDGDLKRIDQEEATKLSAKTDKITTHKNRVVQSYLNATNAAATPDTLSIRDLPGGSWAVNFGYEGQDWMIQWFKAPADLDIVACAFAPSEPAADFDPNNVQLKIVKMAWTLEELFDITSDAQHLGYYEATGNGKHDKTALLDNIDRTGDWVDAGNAATSPFGNDIWADLGAGADVTVTSDDVGGWATPNYMWVEMSLLGFQPSVLQDEIFGVVVHNSGGSLGDGVRAGMYGNTGLGVGAFKFYADGRSVTGGGGDEGWWARKYSWDMVVAVSLTGDRGPKIESMTALYTTLGTAARTVEAVITDDNPSGGAAGVASAILKYSLDDGTTWTDVAMTGSEPNYSGVIPGQSAGTEILYYIYTVDVGGLSTTSSQIFYSIFAKSEDVLFLYNADDLGEGSARHYYVGAGTAQPIGHDYWSTAVFGAVEIPEVLALYDNVIQVDGSYPSANLTAEIDTWIKTGTVGAEKRYFLSSQDIGCELSGDCSDIGFEAGSFMHDFLGVDSLSNQDFSSDSPHLPPLVPVADDPVSGWVATYNAANSVTYHYDPYTEGLFTNYIDNIVAVDGGNVVVTFTTLDSVGGTEQTVGVSNKGDGFYTAFITYDYLGCNFRANFDSSTFDDPDYAWGIDVANQAAEFLEWAGFSSIESDLAISPHAFRLAQNYPNPFNPTTTIEYSIPNKAKVTLKVFDIQGREVVTLVDKKEAAGKHTVNFDASKFATGIYFYQLNTSDNQALVKKMMFIK
jgi:hypothetical protein